MYSSTTDYTAVEQYRLVIMVMVLLAAPVVAMGVAAWAWIVAIYWLFAAMVGNPDGLDGRNDGRELVLDLREWWIRWLMKAVRDD